jgi:hypothetical protein
MRNGNVPAFTGTSSFMQVFPIGRLRLLEFCNMQDAPVIRNGRKFIIRTEEMIEFISNRKL